MAHHLAPKRFAREPCYRCVFSICFLLIGECAQDMRWCGEPLNPWDNAKAGSVATGIFYSCKDEVKNLNIPGGSIKETDRVCASVRMCYAFVQENKNQVMDMYDVDVDKYITSMKGCATRQLPKDVRYALRTLTYIKDFITG